MDDFGQVKDKVFGFLKDVGRSAAPKVLGHIAESLANMSPTGRSLAAAFELAKKAFNPDGAYPVSKQNETQVSGDRVQSDMMYRPSNKPSYKGTIPPEVDTMSIAAALCPELYASRAFAVDYPNKTQLYDGDIRKDFTSGTATGETNVYVQIQTNNIFGEGTSASNAFIISGNSIDANGNIVNPQFEPGPLFVQTSTAVLYSVKALSVNVSFPNSSDTNAGFV